jgi:hypothetical protein
MSPFLRWVWVRRIRQTVFTPAPTHAHAPHDHIHTQVHGVFSWPKQPVRVDPSTLLLSLSLSTFHHTHIYVFYLTLVSSLHNKHNPSQPRVCESFRSFICNKISLCLFMINNRCQYEQGIVSPRLTKDFDQDPFSSTMSHQLPQGSKVPESVSWGGVYCVSLTQTLKLFLKRRFMFTISRFGVGTCGDINGFFCFYEEIKWPRGTGTNLKIDLPKSKWQIFLFIIKTMRWEVKKRLIYDCRCDERLKGKVEESTRLTYTGWIGELEHLQIETRWIDEMFTSVMGEYVKYCCLLWIDKVR